MVLDNGQVGVHTRQKSIVLAFDPGRDKTGFAFADSEGRLLLSGIFPSSEREGFFEALKAGNVSQWVIEGVNADLWPDVGIVAVGNGTHGQEFAEYVRDTLGVGVVCVDERNTTLEARGLYWKLHRPGVLMRLLPEGLRVPARVLDDLAAWSIALRALRCGL